MSKSDDALSVQQIFNQIELELGAGLVPRIFRLLEVNPILLNHLWGQFRVLVLQGLLPRTLKEMIGIIVAVTTHCEYVRTIHLHSLSLQSVANEALKALAEGDYNSEQLSTQTRQVLRWAALAASTHAGYTGSDWPSLRLETSQTLQTIGLDEDEIIELTATVGLFEELCTLANLLELDPSQP